MTLKINEIFQSIQGESTWAGLPFVFIRLTGCNLRCSYCDTRYAYDEGTDWQVEKIVRHISRYQCNRVTVTGGEPLFQAGTPFFVAQLLELGYTVTVETNGSLDIGSLDSRCVRIVDIKCPSSGMEKHNLWANLNILTHNDQLKFVIADRADFEFACDTVKMLKDRLPAGHILFSPAYGVLPGQMLAQWIIDGHMDTRMQLQLHKYIWPREDRGR